MEPSKPRRPPLPVHVRAAIDCEIQGDLICVATPLDLVDFGILFLNWLVPFLVGMIAGAFWIGLAV